MPTIGERDPVPSNLYVAEDESKSGHEGPFHAVYRTNAREERFGWYCSNCGGVDTVMDTLERIDCTDCENRHSPRTWDAAYL
ncbi:MAG: DUF5816 domain-containing protein [Halobacteriales archaeon]